MLRADRWVLTNPSSAALRLAKWLLMVVRVKRDRRLIRCMRMLIRGEGVNGKSRVCPACGTGLKRVAESRIGKSAPKAPFRLGGRAGRREWEAEVAATVERGHGERSAGRDSGGLGGGNTPEPQDDLVVYARALVEGWPRLTQDQRDLVALTLRNGL